MAPMTMAARRIGRSAASRGSEPGDRWWPAWRRCAGGTARHVDALVERLLGDPNRFDPRRQRTVGAHRIIDPQDGAAERFGRRILQAGDPVLGGDDAFEVFDRAVQRHAIVRLNQGRQGLDGPGRGQVQRHLVGRARPERDDGQPGRLGGLGQVELEGVATVADAVAPQVDAHQRGGDDADGRAVDADPNVEPLAGFAAVPGPAVHTAAFDGVHHADDGR